jgi:glucose/arabinose dehydrogenase
MAPRLSLQAIVLFLSTVLLLSRASAQTTCATVAPKFAPVVAAGYTAKVLMNGLKTPRGMIFDSQGNLLIVEQGGAGVRLVKLTDGDGTNVCVASSKQLIADSSVCNLYKFCKVCRGPLKQRNFIPTVHCHRTHSQSC